MLIVYIYACIMCKVSVCDDVTLTYRPYGPYRPCGPYRPYRPYRSPNTI